MTEKDEFRVKYDDLDEFEMEIELEQEANAPPSSPKSKIAESGQTTALNRISLDRNKAGLGQVDVNTVNKVIYETSKDSRFFKDQERRDEQTTAKIQELQKKLKHLKTLDLSTDERMVDNLLKKWEESRDLSQTIVHVDMDAFYAAVEELDKPELKNVPMAVGGIGMLCTANYEARKYGVRAAMPGYIALRLCPELQIIKLNFDKYIAASEKVRRVLAQYDEYFATMSLDEAYLNITPYMTNHPDMTSSEIVEQMRREIFEATGLTASAGISSNTRLAKICSDFNKPNGQCLLPHDAKAIREFVAKLPARKIPGIGKVTDRILKEVLEVNTCGDVLEQRVLIYKLFSQKAFEFLMTSSLGLGNTVVDPGQKSDRKSISCERTFRDLSNHDELIAKLEELCHHLWEDMQESEVLGCKNVSLKLKESNYRVHTRAKTVIQPVKNVEDLKHYAMEIFKQVLKENPKLELRLMGVRASHLIFKKEEVDLLKWFQRAEEKAQQQAGIAVKAVEEEQDYECPLCFQNFNTTNFKFNLHVDTCLKATELKKLQGVKPKERSVASYFKKTTTHT